MTVQLTPEQEPVAGQAIQAGLIRIADDIVSLGITAIRQHLDDTDNHQTADDGADFTREFRAWVHRHRTDTPLLSDEAISRPSICGLPGQ